MTNREITFDRFVDVVFSADNEEFRSDFPFQFYDPQLLAVHTIRLFRDPKVLLGKYSEDEISSGIFEFISLICDSDLGEQIFSPAVMRPTQQRIVYSMRFLFTLLFRQLTPASTPPPEHKYDDDGPIGHVCHMFWDCFASEVDREDSLRHLIPSVFSTLECILSIPHFSIQFSALHGIGHFAKYDRPLADRIVQQYLDSEHDFLTLRRYAMRAATGKVL